MPTEVELPSLTTAEEVKHYLKQPVTTLLVSLQYLFPLSARAITQARNIRLKLLAEIQAALPAEGDIKVEAGDSGELAAGLPAARDFAVNLSISPARSGVYAFNRVKRFLIYDESTPTIAQLSRETLELGDAVIAKMEESVKAALDSLKALPLIRETEAFTARVETADESRFKTLSIIKTLTAALSSRAIETTVTPSTGVAASSPGAGGAAIPAGGVSPSRDIEDQTELTLINYLKFEKSLLNKLEMTSQLIKAIIDLINEFQATGDLAERLLTLRTNLTALLQSLVFVAELITAYNMVTMISLHPELLRARILEYVRLNFPDYTTDEERRTILNYPTYWIGREFFRLSSSTSGLNAIRRLWQSLHFGIEFSEADVLLNLFFECRGGFGRESSLLHPTLKHLLGIKLLYRRDRSTDDGKINIRGLYPTHHQYIGYYEQGSTTVLNGLLLKSTTVHGALCQTIANDFDALHSYAIGKHAETQVPHLL
ncbi:MAG: hypothetical protein A3E87_09765 [Gammaproteobacteria bacterium RIFCSPHIGHO2_12_FULL_35_23]|nr:MAG: hypothetical protein A3E87_09765 [Gammaproteobacteria bacterium RIFCSPHIGHO2_12_FULL_35_23]